MNQVHLHPTLIKPENLKKKRKKDGNEVRVREGSHFVVTMLVRSESWFPHWLRALYKVPPPSELSLRCVATENIAGITYLN